MKNYAKIWDKGNNEGCGYAVGNDGDDIDEIKGIGVLVYPSCGFSDGFAVYRDGEKEIIVGDAYGPWAVDV